MTVNWVANAALRVWRAKYCNSRCGLKHHCLRDPTLSHDELTVLMFSRCWAVVFLSLRLFLDTETPPLVSGRITTAASWSLALRQELNINTSLITQRFHFNSSIFHFKLMKMKITSIIQNKFFWGLHPQMLTNRSTSCKKFCSINTIRKMQRSVCYLFKGIFM